MNTPAASQPAPAPAETLSGDALASSLIGDAAAVPTPPPPAETAPAVTAAPLPAGYQTDAIGRKFDPARFRQKPDGSPFLNARGHFMPKGGRKPGRATGTASETAARPSYVPPLPEAPKVAEPAAGAKPDAVPPPPVAPAVNRSAMERTAEGYLRIAYLAADKFMDGKGEWKPDDAAEHSELKETLADHLTATNGKPLPSWAQFLVAAGIFVLKRFDRPNTAKTARYYWQKMNGVKPAQPAGPAKPAQPAAPFHPLTIEPLR